MNQNEAKKHAEAVDAHVSMQDSREASGSTTDSAKEEIKETDAHVLVDESVAKKNEADNVVDAKTTIQAASDDSTPLPASIETKDETIEVTNKASETIRHPTEESNESSSDDVESLSVEERKEKLEQELAALQEKRDKLATIATNGSLIDTFLSSTGHQLTHYGLHELYDYVKEESLCVFFRNNHFATLTKHKGVLYLLVTDLGYANVPDVMWEKLDGIDGDTEYVNAAFTKPAPQAALAPAPGPSLNPEVVLAQRGQVDRDLQLALQLSKRDSTSNIDEEEGKLVAAATEASLRSYNGIEDGAEETKTEEVSPEETVEIRSPFADGILDGCSTQEDSDKLIAMQMQAQMDNEDASLSLARKLQEQERQLAAAARNNSTGVRRKPASTGSRSKESNCVIS